MTNYRRFYIPGGTYFFTVNLNNRSQRLLVENIDALRQVRVGRISGAHPPPWLGGCASLIPPYVH
ncbi:hypothetical protein [Methylomagnum sp.]